MLEDAVGLHCSVEHGQQRRLLGKACLHFCAPQLTFSPIVCNDAGTLVSAAPSRPTIVHWPGVVNPGTVNQELISSLDWFPTLTHIVEIPLNPSVVYDGVENSEAIFHGGVLGEKDPAQSNRKHFPYYSSMIGNGPGGEWPPLFAIRDKQFKLHFYTKGANRPATGRPDWTYRDAGKCAAHVAASCASALSFFFFLVFRSCILLELASAGLRLSVCSCQLLRAGPHRCFCSIPFPC